jgi:Pectate lyase superfamily protein
MDFRRLGCGGVLVFAVITTACGSTEQGARRATPPGAPATGAWYPRILESRNASDYLPDFSYAGYRWGEDPPPSVAPTLGVTDFGARPDDDVDDTAAIREALAAAAKISGRVVLHFPRGKFVVENILFLERSNLVLQGAGSGPGGTVLSFPAPLARMDKPEVIKKREAYLVANDKRVDGAMFSPFSWTGGVIWTRNPRAGAPEVLGPALSGKRGEHALAVANAASVRAGDLVRINWYNRRGDDSPLLRHVYGLSHRSFGPRPSENSLEPLVAQDVSVVAVNGGVLTLKQPLLHDVEADWANVTRSALLEGVGIEHLAIQFPDVPYGGHHREAGYNGIYLTGLAHSWVRDVRIENADSAILMDDCANVTLDGLSVAGRQGHYGIHVGDVYNVLVQNFDVQAEEFHSVSFNTKARGNAVTHGTIRRPSLDQHRGANHQNLFDDIAAVEDRSKSQLFVHGGADYWGPTHGAFNTFWNVRVDFTGRVDSPVDLGTIDDAGPARIVGLVANVPVRFEYAGAYTEGVGRPGIAVPSLYDHQLEKRLRQAAVGHLRAEALPH